MDVIVLALAGSLCNTKATLVELVTSAFIGPPTGVAPRSTLIEAVLSKTTWPVQAAPSERPRM
jgi:hypothetical protein